MRRLKTLDLGTLPAWSAIVMAGCLIAGIVLRLIWPDDIEYKADERWTFEHAMALLAGSPWPWVGLPTSIGSPNPGMSLWVFAGLAYVSGAQTPPELARAVQSLNVLALLALMAFAFAAVEREARERWLWAGALWAANPLAIIFERKIWPPSVLPLATVALIACWWFRRHATASFLCGLLLALMAQVHLGIVFLAAALFAWTWLRDGASFRWLSWIAGGALGALPALPWLIASMSAGGGEALRWRIPLPHFFIRWVLQPFGFPVEYTLGRAHFLDFLAFPWIGDVPTYAMALLHAVLAAIFVVVMVRAVRAVMMMRARPDARSAFIGDNAEAVLVNAVLWGYGGLLTLITFIGPSSHRHYLIAVAPVMAIWCVRLVFAGGQDRGWLSSRAILAALCIAQVALSAGLIDYIHRTQIIHGEYGPTWRSQQPDFVSTKPRPRSGHPPGQR